MSSTDLICIRHGETQWNTAGRVQGHLNSDLTSNGIKQAQAVARRLSQQPFNHLYSSDLGRALETAKIIGKACDKTVTTDPDWRERHMGIFQGLTRDEMLQQIPAQRKAYETDKEVYHIPQGESVLQRRQRGERVMARIAQQHEGETTVAVSHGGFISTMLEIALDLAPQFGRNIKDYNTSFNQFRFENQRWYLVTWGDISHLEGMPLVDNPAFKTYR